MNNQTEEQTGKYNLIIATLLVGCIVVIGGVALVVSNFNNIAGWLGQRATTNVEKIGQTFYLKSLDDPDKDKDGLEDEIIEAQVYKTDPKKTDTDGNGMSDGGDIYTAYRNAFTTNNEASIKEYESNFASVRNEQTFKVGSLEEIFNLRGMETYSIYVGLPYNAKEKVKTALEFRLKGDYQKSLEILNTELLASPDSSMLKYHLGLTYHGMKEYDKALSIYESLVNDPIVKSPQLYSDLAAANYGLGKGDKFVEYLELSVKNFPEELTQYLKLADYYKETNQLDKEEVVLNQGLKIEPRYAAFYNALAILAYSRGDMGKELDLYKTATSYDFRDASAHFNLSVLFDQYKNDLNSALVEIRIAMSLDQNNPKYMSRASVIYAALGKKDKAKELEDQVLKLGVVSADVFNELGLKYDNQGDSKQAEIYYRKAIQADPKFPNAYNNLGTVLAVTKRESEAIINYKKAIELDQNYANAYNNLGTLYKDLGNYTEAVVTLQKAIKLNPSLPNPYMNLGEAYRRMQDYHNAVINFKKAVSLGVTEASVLENIRILEKLP